MFQTWYLNFTLRRTGGGCEKDAEAVYSGHRGCNADKEERTENSRGCREDPEVLERMLMPYRIQKVKKNSWRP